MGVFGGDDGAKLDAELALIKTRLDTIERSVSTSDLDAKLHAVYTLVAQVKAAVEQNRTPAAPQLSGEGADALSELIGTLTDEVKALAQMKEGPAPDGLGETLARIDGRLASQQQTMSELTSAIRSLIAVLSNR